MASSSNQISDDLETTSLFRKALRKLNNKEELNDEEFQALPQHYRKIYLLPSSIARYEEMLAQNPVPKVEETPRRVQKLKRHILDYRLPIADLPQEDQELWEKYKGKYDNEYAEIITYQAERYAELESRNRAFDQEEQAKLEQAKQADIAKKQAIVTAEKEDYKNLLAEAESQYKLKDKYMRDQKLKINAKVLSSWGQVTRDQTNILNYKPLTRTEIKAEARKYVDKNFQWTYPEEVEAPDMLGHKFAENKRIDIDVTDILEDVIANDYTLQDVHLVCEGGAGIMRDATDKSPIQLLDKVVESITRKTKNTLRTPASGHFFNNIDADILARQTPLQLNETVNQSLAGIELIHGNPMVKNDAKEAINSYVKAIVMSEAEAKICQVVKNAETKQKQMDQQRTDESMAETAAVVGAFSEADEAKKTQHLGFNITDEEFDISFTPVEDPDCYKPLEIISYLAMTN